MNAFITGSREYGIPKPNSDMDLVVLVDEATERRLRVFSENGTFPIRFGTLNLITTTSPEEFAAWLVATRTMTKSGRPHDRDEATRVIAKVKERVGILLDKDFPSATPDE